MEKNFFPIVFWKWLKIDLKTIKSRGENKRGRKFIYTIFPAIFLFECDQFPYASLIIMY